MADMTPTQGRYLAYIQAYTEGFGLPPAEAEIADAIGVAPPSVNQMMKTLEKKGLIRRTPGVPRSIEILIPRDAIPNWVGKRITRTVMLWTRSRPVRQTTQLVPTAVMAAAVIYRFKITLQDFAPPIWRRIETKDVLLEDLHIHIQTAMGWTNSHLHQFGINGESYTDARLMMDDIGAVNYEGMRVSDLIAKHGKRLRMGYDYDFGDGWRHEIVLEKVTEAEPRVKYPRCIDGEHACPPEDIGGVFGFAEYLEAIKDPKHPEHENYLEWNGPFDFSKFDPQVATRRMRKGLPKW